jgi:type III secretion protein R
MTVVLAAGAEPTPDLVSHLGLTALLATVPLLLIAATSFLKIALVLGSLRSALGSPGLPPASVLTAIAAVLSMFVMAPVGAAMLDAIEMSPLGERASPDPLGIEEARAVYLAASPPLVEFLDRNATEDEVEFFQGMLDGAGSGERGLRILLPAFASGEFMEGIVIGALIFLPFLVIDLIVGLTLAALGLHMLAPAAISLPLKLLLFIAVDGWHILLAGLLVNYGP